MVLLGTLRCQKVPQGQVARGHPSICSPKVILNITMVFLRCLVGIWRTGWAFSSKVWLPAPKSIIPVPAFIHTHKKKKKERKEKMIKFLRKVSWWRLGFFVPGPSLRFFLSSWLLEEAAFGSASPIFFPSAEFPGCHWSLVMSKWKKSFQWSSPTLLKPSSITTTFSSTET